MIGKLLQRLSKQQSSSNYSRQKNSLEKELASFLSSLSSPSLAFLVWKDRNGKTLVHLRDCVWFVHTQVYSTLVAVPATLLLEQWTPLIGKLRSTFATQGKGFRLAASSRGG
ncbi:unnamed protein product [Porites lobata]|uniref:ALOG domain-containing protein n=1 Tax=Porites lobata TaxID=104759 RepID=A0ABN8QXL9_9CNID|nr:unnamed protein product [Porites lobata]